MKRTFPTVKKSNTDSQHAYLELLSNECMYIVLSFLHCNNQLFRTMTLVSNYFNHQKHIFGKLFAFEIDAYDFDSLKTVHPTNVTINNKMFTHQQPIDLMQMPK